MGKQSQLRTRLVQVCSSTFWLASKQRCKKYFPFCEPDSGVKYFLPKRVIFCMLCQSILCEDLWHFIKIKVTGKIFLVVRIKLFNRTTELDQRMCFVWKLNINSIIFFKNFCQIRIWLNIFCELGSQDLPLFAPLDRKAGYRVAPQLKRP